jgi:quinol monooxygenase YgiN
MTNKVEFYKLLVDLLVLDTQGRTSDMHEKAREFMHDLWEDMNALEQHEANDYVEKNGQDIL